MNEKVLVEPLLDRVLGEDLEVELAVGDSQLESQNTFDALEARKVDHIIVWRRIKGRVNPLSAHGEGPHQRGRSRVEESDLQEDEGDVGGPERQGEEPSCLQQVHVTGIGER